MGRYGLVLNGRVAYLAADLDRRYARSNLPDHGNLLANIARWAIGERNPLEVHGAGLIDCHLYRQSNRLILHLVNLTNPIMMKGPVREIIPISSQRVYVPVPSDRCVTKAHLLVAGNEIPFHKEGDMTVLEVPTINLHEVIALDY